MARTRHVLVDDDTGKLDGDEVASNRTFTFTPGTGYTEVVTSGNGFNCLGSGCMMWRWRDDTCKSGFCGLSGSPKLEHSQELIDALIKQRMDEVAVKTGGVR